MAKFKEIQEKNETFRCDCCKKEIKANEIKLIEAADNVTIHMPICSFLYVDKDGKIMGGGEQPSRKKGDKLFACPYCNEPHLFGMDLA